MVKGKSALCRCQSSEQGQTRCLDGQLCIWATKKNQSDSYLRCDHLPNRGGDTETTEMLEKQITRISCEIAVKFVEGILITGMVLDAARARIGSVAQLNNFVNLNELAF